MFYIVSTPIGNLEDITLRAIRILKEVDLIIAEDTRRTGQLLKHLEIEKKMISYHEHSSDKKENAIIEMLIKGKNIALVSDAGTPLLSDPGYTIIKKAIDNNIQISPIPGANALLPGLISSGCTTDKFMFLGFFPKKNKEQNKIIELIKKSDMTIAIYESPYRIKKTINKFAEHFPERKICIAREITKKFEEFIRGQPSHLIEELEGRELKGEIVILIDKPLKSR